MAPIPIGNLIPGQAYFFVNRNRGWRGANPLVFIGIDAAGVAPGFATFDAGFGAQSHHNPATEDFYDPLDPALPPIPPVAPPAGAGIILTAIPLGAPLNVNRSEIGWDDPISFVVINNGDEVIVIGGFNSRPYLLPPLQAYINGRVAGGYPITNPFNPAQIITRAILTRHVININEDDEENRPAAGGRRRRHRRIRKSRRYRKYKNRRSRRKN